MVTQGEESRRMWLVVCSFSGFIDLYVNLLPCSSLGILARLLAS